MPRVRLGLQRALIGGKVRSPDSRSPSCRALVDPLVNESRNFSRYSRHVREGKSIDRTYWSPPAVTLRPGALLRLPSRGLPPATGARGSRTGRVERARLDRGEHCATWLRVVLRRDAAVVINRTIAKAARCAPRRQLPARTRRVVITLPPGSSSCAATVCAAALPARTADVSCKCPRELMIVDCRRHAPEGEVRLPVATPQSRRDRASASARHPRQTCGHLEARDVARRSSTRSVLAAHHRLARSRTPAPSRVRGGAGWTVCRVRVPVNDVNVCGDRWASKRAALDRLPPHERGVGRDLLDALASDDAQPITAATRPRFADPRGSSVARNE